MNEPMIKIEHNDYTETYNFYMAADGKPYPIIRSFIEETSGDSKVNLDELPYAAWIYPTDTVKSLSLTIPEKKYGHTVRAVSIISTPLYAPVPTRCDLIKLKYLYIPSTVHYIYIENTERNGADLLNECVIEISPDNPYLCVYEHGIYSKDMTELYYIFSLAECSDGRFEVPSGVLRIQDCAGHALRGLRRLTIPESVETIEDEAFRNCYDLEYAEIGARIIGERAFCRCNSLKEVRLSDRLQTIGDYAFAYSEIKKLTIPPDVRNIGQEILRNSNPHELTLEIYSKNGTLPKMHASPAEIGTLLVILSAETNEKLCEFVILGSIYSVITGHGIDFTKYDKLFEKNFNDQKFSFKVGLRAAQVRLSQLSEADSEKREFFKQYIVNAAFLITLNAVIQYPDKAFDDDIKSPKYIDLVSDDDLMGLIDEAAHLQKPEITALLMQRLHERRKNS